MITLKNIKNTSGEVADHTIESDQSQIVEGYGHLLMLPACIDTDALKTVAFATDGGVPWLNKVRSYLEGGITTVFDARGCPASNFLQYNDTVQAALQKNKLSLHYHCFCDGNEPALYDSIGKVKEKSVGIKISLDLDKKPIAPPHLSSIDRIFQIAAQENLIVVIAMIQGKEDPAVQRQAAYQSMEKMISFAEKYSTELCLQHVRTAQELALIKEAKEGGILVHSEVAYIHLFVSDREYTHKDSEGSRTFFLPSKDDQEALWNGINEGTVDMVGSAGLLSPPELFVPMMIQGHLEGRLSLGKFIEVTRSNAESIFRLPLNKDVILVDLVEEKDPKPKLNGKEHPMFLWDNKKLKGWAKHTVASGSVFMIG